ncbi:RNA polymerase II subunit A C-terminal domain phosphatase [Astathelohania contejeani]|uniref:RNA polymerase II subunit A C-terminal domain phosphatase n=1 Tax=Astathelohania contejeani TaxID=164912 RepID=A0ABQ7I1R7_9MICR|nr:RNA polymerase II subunit A C-terminal domain phosphatase [Thelohania contejeani]
MHQCKHPIRLGTLCGVCGKDMSDTSDSLYCPLYTTDAILATKEEASKIINQEVDDNKLILILDLDQTLIHASMNPHIEDLISKHSSSSIDPLQSEIDSIHSFVIDNINYYIKLRPHLSDFLKKLQPFYQFFVYTMGNRIYANKVISIIDPTGEYFGDRIVTRDENLGMLSKSIERIVPNYTERVVILDDRADVWKFSKSLVLIKPYYFFVEGDINNPDLMHKNTKHEIIDKQILDPPINKKKLIYANFYDTELAILMNYFETLHTKYFNTNNKSVKHILKETKKAVFKGLKFYISDFNRGYINRKYIKGLIILHGGKIKRRINKQISFIISEKENPEIIEKGRKYKRNIIHYKWVLESVFAMRQVEPMNFLISETIYDDYTDFIDDLENEFFNDPLNGP